MINNYDFKWDEQYPIVIKSRRDNWGLLTGYLQYTPMIRKLHLYDQYGGGLSSSNT